MSKKQWLVLLMLFLTYLLLGASIFYHIEREEEEEKIAKAKIERIEINQLLRDHYVSSIGHTQKEIFDKLTDYCGKPVHNYTEGEVDPHKWDFYNSFYFAYTVVSTIGYGNLAPTNTLSRILMIFYGLVGIPMNGILLTQLGEFFSHVFIKAHQKYKSYKSGQSSSDYTSKKPTPFETRKVGLAAQILMYLTPGFVMFIFFPAFLFSHYEGWSYDQSVYYAFVTLTTIGFGDLVAGQDDTKGSGPFFIMYKIFLIFWISFGLGYIVMIMTFIARGMRSKKITRLEHKLAMNLKHTQSKIWNEFNKEVNYLRRVFNELQLSKVKRIYVDEYDYEIPPTKFLRSNSFPDLRKLTIGGYVDNCIPHPRRRANSEVVPAIQLTRVVSETDLQRIDKNATFATHAIVQPAELLARLVNILGYIPPRDDFDWDETEDQLKQNDAQNEMQQSKPVDQSLANNVTQWTIGGEKFPFAKPRSRAVSEMRLYAKDYAKDDVHQNTEWTWSGPVASTKLKELMKTRNTITSVSSNNSNKPYKKFPSFALPITAPKNFFPRWKKHFMNKKSSDVGPNTEKVIDTMDDSNRQNNSIGPMDQLSSYLDERYDSISKTPNYYTHTGCNLPSYMKNNNLLEETSLADFLRALTALHARVGTVPDECIAKPKRKLGTACLSPPKLPSLFTLFSNMSGSDSVTHSNQNTVTDVNSHQSSKRMSFKMPENGYSGSTTPTSYMRKESSAVKPRRFSLRPVKTPVNSVTPPDYASPRSSLRLSQRMTDRNFQVPYTSTEPFISVSPKEPLVNMEGPPGISSPIKQPFNTRRFSIRSAQLGTQPSATNTSTPLHTPKPLPRWKAGMLQRQITQMNLRRRVRAFSLSDVYSDIRERSTNPISPLAMDTTNKFVDVSKLSNPNQKTVTIMSPAEEMNMTLKNEFQDSMVTPENLKDEQISSWRNQEDVTPIKSLSFKISDEPSAELNESRISNILEDRRYSQGNSNFISVYEPVYKLRSSDEKLINDTLDKTVQMEVQERNMDVKDASLKMEKQNDMHMCIIDNLDEPQEAKFSTSSKNFPESRKEKPSVPIDFYKPLLQATIEKPAINPFEQYRVMTKSGQTKDAELTEIKVEKPHEK
ncbi:Open rectifier potassium channel protein 1 [Formica fusca]